MTEPFAPTLKGVQFICSFEGFRSMPYRDGGGLWTIGYGYLIPQAEMAQFAAGITQEQGYALMQVHLINECKVLAQSALQNLLPHQKDAVISLAYNIGVDYFWKETTIYKRIMAQAYDLNSWLWLDKDAKGVVEPGLDRRRLAELRLFMYGNYSTG